METFSIECGNVNSNKEAKEVIMINQSNLKSPCIVELNAANGKRVYYAEKSNVGISGAGWIVSERKI